VCDVVFTYKNNQIIHVNSHLQKQAESVKVSTSQFAIVIIHNLDLGLRGYALFGKEKYLNPLKFALRDKDSIMLGMESILVEQKYPLQEFNQLRDSINAYANFCLHLKALFDQKKIDEFQQLSDLDKGYHLWLQYEAFAKKVYLFEDEINRKATEEYEEAIRRNYFVQIFLFMICVPALLVMARHTVKKFVLSEELRKSDFEKSQILMDQNVKLEEMVQSRTRDLNEKNEELQKRNEEIASQNEELTSQQDEMASQRNLLEVQNQKLNQANLVIETKN
jgi:CHASE3 domain sensor protein